ncbi:DUF1549 domain-containing protein [Armatimonas rosea]|uniref:Cytochrome c553 n=1 Tax=Armatimonas rosea TaxID=685828 RepID=A0A7W9W7J3_ARMRO|nr:DUF1549 domain-containing protein [Armatimonas rosea]MBB6051150.1 cytochrome c553 [Armatimonas rosea]
MRRQLFGAVGALGLAAMAAMATGKSQEPAKTLTAEQTAFFESKVRPLILAKCEGCHGEAGASAGLRLDKAIPADKLAAVLQRVKGEGGKPRMPLNNAPLSPGEVAVVAEWTKQGGFWPASAAAPNGVGSALFAMGKTHWAFQPVKRVAPPTVKSAAWVRNPIDAFVLAKLEAKNLKPSPTATRRELIRRVTYDLTGLPPTPEEVAAFEADKAPDAYEKLVDRLLASPHYGEKWGRQWLDLMRYAETNSYERDNPKPQPWRYRDYVIKSFNADKPYDRFVKEQLAGDELPDGGNDGLLATGFYRLGIWDDEPTDREQARYDGLDDIVTTVGQTFMGLTFDCARCHNHKIDPILQKDYYKLVSFFNGINHFRNGGPTDEKPIFENEAQRADYLKRVDEKKQKLDALQLQLKALENAAPSADPSAGSDLDDLTYKYYRDTFEKLPSFDTLKPERTGPVPSKRFDITLRDRDSAIGFVFEGTLVVPKAGRYTFFLDSDDGSRLVVNGQELIKHDGIHGQGNEQSKAVQLEAGRVPIRLEYFQNQFGIGLAVSWAGPGPRAPRRLLSTSTSNGPEGQASVAVANPEYARLKKQLEDLKNQPVAVDRALCVTEMDQPQETFVLLRGSAAAPADKVEPGWPEILGGGDAKLPGERISVAPSTGEPVRGGRPSIPAAQLSESSSGRRLTLASWIASPDNKLTGRVMANRVWQGHFGRGIVRSASNFGLGGDSPTHPELLDYLASSFTHELGWSVKKLHKLILTSNTYKQSSRSNPVALKADPQNNLFWRMDMRRLTAEELRDSVLAVCGNLNPKLYGPSVYPDIPAEVLHGQSVPGKDWYPDRMKPEDKARRSIYIFVKRSLIFPLMDSFDMAETDRTTPSRFSSTQPTQALTTLNGKFFHDQAKVLAARLDKESNGNLEQFVARGLTLATQRPPTPSEITRGLKLIKTFESQKMSTEQAKSTFCLLTLNLNEFMYLD